MSSSNCVTIDPIILTSEHVDLVFDGESAVVEQSSYNVGVSPSMAVTTVSDLSSLEDPNALTLQSIPSESPLILSADTISSELTVCQYVLPADIVVGEFGEVVEEVELCSQWAVENRGVGTVPCSSATELQLLNPASSDMLFTVVDDTFSMNHLEDTKNCLDHAIISEDVMFEKHNETSMNKAIMDDSHLTDIDGCDSVTSLNGVVLSDELMKHDSLGQDVDGHDASLFTFIHPNKIQEANHQFFDKSDRNLTLSKIHPDDCLDEAIDLSSDISIPGQITDFSVYPNIILGYADQDPVNKSVKFKVQKVNSIESSLKNRVKKVRNSGRKEPPLQCKECNLFFRKPEDLKAHMENHLKKLQNSCPLCNAEFNSKPALQVHIRQHFTKSLSCDECLEQFADKAQLNKHKIEDHNLNSGSDLISTTKNGSSEAQQIVQFVRNSNAGKSAVIKPNNKRVTGASSTAPAKVFKCSLCKLTFACRAELKQHSNTHWQKPFKCEECGATFTQNGSLQVHIRRHRGEKPFTCKLCGNSYTRAFSLKVHMKTHTGEKPHNCEYCSSSFITSSHLNVHRRIHTGERPFSCTECSATFITTSHLNVHKKIHLISSSSSVRCSQCNLTLRDNAQLRIHRKAHHPQKNQGNKKPK